MEAELRTAVACVAGFLYASTGFLLSAFATLLSPWMPSEVVQSPAQHPRLSSVQFALRTKHKKRLSFTSSENPSDVTVSSTNSESPASIILPAPSSDRSNRPQLSPLKEGSSESEIDDQAPLPMVHVGNPMMPFPSTSATTTEIHDQMFLPTPPSPGENAEGGKKLNHTRSFYIPHLHRAFSKKRTPNRTSSSPVALNSQPSVIPQSPPPFSPPQRKNSWYLKRPNKCIRRTLSVPDGELSKPKSKSKLKSKKSHRSPCLSPSVSEKLSSPPRTNPYDAPYFFPLPGSPEAVDYVRQTRESNVMRTMSLSPKMLSPSPFPAELSPSDDDGTKRIHVRARTLSNERAPSSSPPNRLKFFPHHGRRRSALEPSQTP